MTSARITCEDCGKYLGMEEGWYDKCPKCRKNIKKDPPGKEETGTNGESGGE